MTGDSSVFHLPDVGEGLTEAEIVTWRVTAGDIVALNDVIVEIETAKSLVELPSPYAGRVAEILVPEGRTVPVGEPLIVIAADEPEPAKPDPAKPDPAKPDPAKPESAEPEPAEPEPAEAAPSVLVGYGLAEGRTRRRRIGRGRAVPSGETAVERPAAKPAVRRLAQRLGVDLAELATPGRPVSREDVERAAAATETRTPVRGVRRAMARAVTASAFTAPQATMWADVDVTASLGLVRALRADERFAGAHVTPLLLVAKALLLAIARNPEINARWDEEAQEIVTPRDVNLGVAVATSRGLVVPNIKGAQRLDLPTLATRLGDAVERARNGESSPDDFAGGTITITNVGALGVDGAVPILNLGETAIIAVGAIRPAPLAVDGAVAVRDVARISITIDHRVADGALGARVLGEMRTILCDPALALAHT